MLGLSLLAVFSHELSIFKRLGVNRAEATCSARRDDIGASHGGDLCTSQLAFEVFLASPSSAYRLSTVLDSSSQAFPSQEQPLRASKCMQTRFI